MKQSVTIKKITWDYIFSPSREDSAGIIREAGISALDAEYITQSDQGPQCIVRFEYKIILLQLPVRNSTTKSIEIHAIRYIIYQHCLATITDQKIPVLENLFAEIKANDAPYAHKGLTPLSLAFLLIDRLNESTLKKVHHVFKRVEIAEDAVFHGNERKMVEEIAVLSRDVLDLHRVALPQKGLFQGLHRQYAFTIPEQDALARVQHQSEQLWNTLQVLHSSMQELRSTNDSLLQHQENELLRMIFSYSIITIPLLALVNEFNPHRAGATYIDVILFWGIVLFLIILLFALFARARKRRVL